MNQFQIFELQIKNLVSELIKQKNVSLTIKTNEINIEPPRNPNHGDLSTNAAMVLAKLVGETPKELAISISNELLLLDDVEKVGIAGPGFINITLVKSFWHKSLLEIIKSGLDYGVSALGKNRKINIEYVSANPTGPLHVAHARGAVTGDVLANLLKKVGYNVTKEYYVNDGGGQIDALARSVYLRYKEALGEDIGDIVEGLYPGKYLIEIGEYFVQRDGNKWLEIAANSSRWHPMSAGINR